MTTPFPFVAGSVLTASALNNITNLPFNTRTASYVLTSADNGYRVTMNSASATTVTVNNNIFAAADTVEVFNLGAGACTITAGAGVTLNGLSLVLNQYQGAQIVFTSASNALVFVTGGKTTVTNVAAFTATGTWTVPAGVTYAIAHIRAGGGGCGTSGSGNGGTSSVAFSGGTISATGGNAANSPGATVRATSAGPANSGWGASYQAWDNNGFDTGIAMGSVATAGAYIVAGGAVTPAASITVTVGAGGTAGTAGAAGGSGYVWIEFQV